MKKLARTLSLLSLAMGSTNHLRIMSTVSLGAFAPKVLSGSLAPLSGVAGALGAALGILSGSRLAAVAGAVGAYTSARYVQRVTRVKPDVSPALHAAWEAATAADGPSNMLQAPWTWRMPLTCDARWERDVPFCEIPQTSRKLLCDVWQPPADTKPSGLAFIYLHGGAWHYLDKDTNTRTLFRHLASQGHVVMDVAYRMAPETDVRGMVGDAKRAIAWMKENAGQYGVHADRIVIAGGSAGAHLALLAAYTPREPELNPPELEGRDVSVRGAVSYYGPADMRAEYRYAEANTREKKPLQELAPRELPGELARRVGGILATPILGRDPTSPRAMQRLFENVIGAAPSEAPHLLELASPIAHVDRSSPPTLLLQGEHDCLVPVETTRALHHTLREMGAPVVYVEFPQTEHAFDLMLTRYSPAAQTSIYYLDRFLALLARP